MKKEELIIQDFVDSIPYRDVQDKFVRLYPDYDENTVKIFSYFHQSFNSFFEFLNYKIGVNGHYNAHESRELIALIEKFEDLQHALKATGNEIIIAKSYAEAIETFKDFLLPSNGSPIPEGFGPLQLIKYEPIFEFVGKAIQTPHLSQTYKLTLVGEGAFSIVQKYRDEYYNKHFALKQARKSLTERELARFKREFEILRDLSFPYVLEVYRYDATKNNYTMEYCDTSLENYITKRNNDLGFENRKKLALQFLYGLNYLHKKGILHRDISLGNILIKIYEYGSALIKLSDFGLVKEELSDFTKTDTEIKGTIIDPCLDNFKDYNQKNEIYAVGFVLWFIFTGKKSLKHETSQLYSIVEGCIDRDMSKRYENIAAVIKEVETLAAR